MSEIIETPDQNKENQDNKGFNKLENQEEKTDKDLFKVLNFIKGMSHESSDNEEVDDKEIDEIEEDDEYEDDFLNYCGQENGSELNRLNRNQEWNTLYSMWKISRKDIKSFFNYEFNPVEDGPELAKFWIISYTKENHTAEEIEDYWPEIIKRRNKIMIIWNTFKRLSIDILDMSNIYKALMEQ